MSVGLTSTIGTQSTSWQYVDNDSALIGSTTYVWVATNAYSGSSNSSAASTPWSGTTSVGRSIQNVKVKVHKSDSASKRR